MQALFYIILLLWATSGESQEDDQQVSRKEMNYYFSSPYNNILRLPVSFGTQGTGVNWFGFHASSGLFKGVFSLNGSPGGPHAEASTPFGLGAGAGVGVRNEKDNSILYAYAEAQAGSIFLGVCLLLEPSGPKIMTFKRCAKRFGLRLHEVYAKRED